MDVQDPNSMGTRMVSGTVAANSSTVMLGFVDRETFSHPVWHLEEEIILSPGDEVVIVVRKKGERGVHPLLWVSLPYIVIGALLIVILLLIGML